MANSSEKPNLKNNGKILKVMTTQTGAFKQAIEGISNIISHCCIVFISPDSKENTGGMHIVSYSNSKTMLVKLKLDADNFDEFKCEEPKITAGIDIKSLHKLLNTINDEDPILIYMNHDNRNILHFSIFNENERTDIEMLLLSISNPEFPLPPMEFGCKITMQCNKFYNICRRLHNIFEYVEIKVYNDEVYFSSRRQNDGHKLTITYKDEEYLKKKDNLDKITSSVFDLKDLMKFNRYNKMSDDIDIYLNNNSVMAFNTSVATLGKMFIFFSPMDTK